MNELEKIQYNCKKATFLIEKKSLDGISLVEQQELEIHLKGCRVCRLFQQQSLLIDEMVKVHLFGPAAEGLKLDTSFKRELHLKIAEELERGD